MTATTVSRTDGRPRPLELEIRRYHRSFRRRLRRLARGSSRLGDLIVAFPAAAFALVSNHAPVSARAEAVTLVKAGAPLAKISAALALPGWIRRLPPEAFSQALGDLTAMAEPGFQRRVASVTPKDPAQAAMWFDWLQSGLRSGGADFALWLAKQPVYDGPAIAADAVTPLGAYAWHSLREDTPPSRQMRRSWREAMGFRAAVSEAREWLRRVFETLRPDAVPQFGVWRGAHRVNGFAFSPRRTKEELTAEGHAMNNCVASYWDLVRADHCLIYSVRRGGGRVATLEVRAHPATGRGYIAQLEGPSNSPPSERVRRAAKLFVAHRGACPLRVGGGFDGVNAALIDARRWGRVWEPYRQARPVADLFPEQPERSALQALERASVALGEACAR